MYSLNDNSQSRDSKERIGRALWKLMETDSFEVITITQICQEAQVARKTFYRNFQYKADIVEYNLDRIFGNFPYKHPDPSFPLEQLLVETYNYALNYGDFFILLQKKDLFHLVQKSYLKGLPDTLQSHSELMNPYILNFISSTFCSVLSLWVENDFKESAEWLADITALFLQGLIR